VRFEVTKVVNMTTVFWAVTLCNLLNITAVLAERPDSIFRTEEYDNSKKKVWMTHKKRIRHLWIMVCLTTLKVETI
jgi:hypothetical protein